MRTIRRIAAIAVTTAALALGPVAVAHAAPTHPQVTDVRGDARAGGVNYPEADIMTTDVVAAGSDLIVTVAVNRLPARPLVGQRDNSYTVAFDLPGNDVLYAFANNFSTDAFAPTFSTSLALNPCFDPEGNCDTGIPTFGVAGTVVEDRVAGTLTLRYPLSEITAASTEVGVATIGATVGRIDVNTRSESFTVATDSASSTEPFTLGD